MIKCTGKSGDRNRCQEVRRDCVKVQAFQKTGLGESKPMWHLIEKSSGLEEHRESFNFKCHLAKPGF